jgi:hypothetical protein
VLLRVPHLRRDVRLADAAANGAVGDDDDAADDVAFVDFSEVSHE